MLPLAVIQLRYLDSLDKKLRTELVGQGHVLKYWHKCGLLAHLISGDVFGLHFFDNALASEKRPDYFKIDDRSPETLHRFFTRKVELGELVLNLHNVKGFSERAKEIGDDPRAIGTKIGELMGGRFFLQNNIPFSFRPPAGIGEQDFDIEYVRTDGKLGRCEVKSKEHDTGFTSKTIFNSLKQARKQLPKGETGIILLRTPEDWVTNDDAAVGQVVAIRDAINAFFEKEKTERVSSVVVFDSRSDVIEGNVYPYCYTWEVTNPHCNDVSGLPISAVSYQGQEQEELPDNWVQICELVAQWDDLLPEELQGGFIDASSPDQT